MRDAGLGPGAGAAQIIGSSAALHRIIDAAMRMASRDVTVLIRGETGSGKELIASLLHAHSARAAADDRVQQRRDPARACGVHLFGHTRGAFTDAVTARDGYFLRAHGGTQLAPALLRYLQRQPWPGNVRELENTVARCVAFATTDTLGLEAVHAARTASCPTTPRPPAARSARRSTRSSAR